MKQEVQEGLQIPTEALGEKYLGIPTIVGRSADGSFDYVAYKIRGFIHGWGRHLLSCAGREVLIKANAQLLAPTCKKIKNYISNYRWGSVTPAFLAPNKSPTKSRVFSKPSR
jgi:hypothetical protein